MIPLDRTPFLALTRSNLWQTWHDGSRSERAQKTGPIAACIDIATNLVSKVNLPRVEGMCQAYKVAKIPDDFEYEAPGEQR